VGCGGVAHIEVFRVLLRDGIAVRNCLRNVEYKIHECRLNAAPLCFTE
jgi:hypothetical protein